MECQNWGVSGVVQGMSQKETVLLLDLIGWANRRLARLGLERDLFIVGGGDHIELYSAAGELLDREFSDYTDSAFQPGAIAVLVLRTEQRWLDFLRGDTDAAWPASSRPSTGKV